jgi:hypothetical protein
MVPRFSVASSKLESHPDHVEKVHPRIAVEVVEVPGVLGIALTAITVVWPALFHIGAAVTVCIGPGDGTLVSMGPFDLTRPGYDARYDIVPTIQWWQEHSSRENSR